LTRKFLSFEMAKHISNFSHFFVILVLVVACKYIYYVVHHSNFFLILIQLIYLNLEYDINPNIFLLLQGWNMGIPQVLGDTKACTTPLGACGPRGNCDQRCKSMHSDGEGSCDLGLCTCVYGCYTPPTPVEPKLCTIGLGLCTTPNECNQKCASNYNHGQGSCDYLGTVNLCNCIYYC
jgi:hypothetical protein